MGGEGRGGKSAKAPWVWVAVYYDRYLHSERWSCVGGVPAPASSDLFLFF